MQPTTLPENIQTICKEFVDGLISILADKLYGVYVYGATVFEDSSRAQDIDCHVVLKAVPTDSDREKLFELHAVLERRSPPLGGEVDAYYILLKDAQGTSPPDDLLRLDIRDESWALHCAHVRAGRYATLQGPEPKEIFPFARLGISCRCTGSRIEVRPGEPQVSCLLHSQSLPDCLQLPQRRCSRVKMLQREMGMPPVSSMGASDSSCIALLSV